MALKPCRECGREVSTEAPTCPGCGAPHPTRPPSKPDPIKRRADSGVSGIKKRQWVGLAIFLTLSFAALLGALLMMMQPAGTPDSQGRAERRTTERERLEASFRAQKDSILQAARDLHQGGQPAEAFRRLNRFSSLDDPDLKALRDSAEEALLVERLRSVPASDAERNANMYRRLTEIRPENGRYASRLEHYEGIVEAEEEAAAAERMREARERQQRLAEWGEPPEPSAWDGTYRVVTEYLRRVANDPESIEMDGCTKVYSVEGKGWLVGCDYRGANAFGGIIRASNWFIIRHGAVVEMADASAYSIR